MSIRISEEEPYMVTLDSLDMQYIHTNMSYVDHSKMADLKPIWSKSGDGRNYYEFEIVDGSNDSDAESLNDFKQYLCHICKTYVPVVFIKQHYASNKHSTMQKLSKKVLERVSKSINLCIDVVENIRKDIYYCDTCSEVVLKCDKLAHNTSENHLTSLKYDDLMKQYLDLFVNGMGKNDLVDTNKKNDIVMTNSKNDNVDKIVRNNDIALTMTDSKSVVMNIKNDNHVKNTSPPLIDEVLDNIWDFTVRSSEKYDTNTEFTLENNSNAQTVTKTNTYAETLSKKDTIDDSFKPLPLNNSESVILYCKGQHKIKIPWNNYHSFLVNESKFFCMLCDEILIETTQDHVVNERHIENVFKPINKHLMRQIDNGFIHCVVCNVLTRARDHITENSHDGILNSYVIKSKVENVFKYCKTCDRQIDVNDKFHEQSVEHALSALRLTSDNKQKAASDSIKTASNNKAIKVKTAASDKSDSKKNVISDHLTEGRTPNERHCQICKVYLPNTSQNISEHIGSSRHGTNLKNFIAENKIKLINNDDYQCETCHIVTKQLVTHVNSLLHKEKCKKIKSNTTQNISNSTKTIPVIVVPDSVNSSKTEDEYCSICDVKLPFGGRPVHEIGLKHKTNLAKLTGSDVVSDDMNLDNKTNINILHARNKLMTKLNNDKQLECKVCKSVISNHDIHVLEHIFGKKHIANYKIYLNK